MGSSAHLEISGFCLLESSSVVDPSLMTLFSEGDRRVFQRKETESVTLEDGSQIVEEEFVDVVG